MGFLRRMFGGGPGSDEPEPEPRRADLADDPGDADADERARELELARFDQERIDELVRRQQRFADRKWTPPAQGGERRADDGDASPG
jgi:hypothetical protein